MFQNKNEQIVFIEPLYTDFHTKLESSTKFSFGIIKISKYGKLTYIGKVKLNSKIDIVIEPFKIDGDKIFLFIYKSEQSDLSKD